MEKIKLVIWDLDETFWKGTLSEEGIQSISENINLVNELTDRGIINSIVSKNDFELAKKKLEELNVWDLFVFPQIDWKPKGELVKKLLKKIYLRPGNVLFLDDNHLNLKEVQFYNPGIHAELPSFIPKIRTHPAFKGKKDLEHSRLKQYKILEKKDVDKESFVSNNDFLRNSNIQISIEKPTEQHIERIHELIERTNQLNYTKKRISKSEVQKLLQNTSLECRIISVKDKYGDYGIIGFYSLDLTNKNLEHFLFSCRTINLGIEQFVYAELNFPELEIVGTVVSLLSKTSKPDWITLISETDTQKHSEKKQIHILLRGGCDLSQMVHYLSYTNLKVKEEFNYVLSNNIPIHREHTFFLTQEETLSEIQKKAVVQELPFLDARAFKSDFFNEMFDVLVFSLLMDYTQGVYIRKKDGIKIPFGGYIDITSLSYSEFKKIYGNYKSNELNYKFYSFFKENYVYGGNISKDQFINNLKLIRSRTKKPIIFINGAEIHVTTKNSLETGAFERHKEMNSVLDDFISNNKNTYLLDMRRLVSQEDITSNLRHYSRSVYKTMAETLTELIKNATNNDFKKRKLLIAMKEFRFNVLEFISAIRKKLL